MSETKTKSSRANLRFLTGKTQATIRNRMWAAGLRHADVACRLGMDPSRFSRILNGREKAPEQFEQDVRQAVEHVAA